MADTVNYEPQNILHPKEMVLEYLESEKWSQRDLAEKTGLSANTISELCSGKAGITAQTALALEPVFNRPAHFWLNLQRRFDEAGAGKDLQNKVAEQHREWSDGSPD